MEGGVGTESERWREQENWHGTDNSRLPFDSERNPIVQWKQPEHGEIWGDGSPRNHGTDQMQASREQRGVEKTYIGQAEAPRKFRGGELRLLLLPEATDAAGQIRRSPSAGNWRRRRRSRGSSLRLPCAGELEEAGRSWATGTARKKAVSSVLANVRRPRPRHDSDEACQWVQIRPGPDPGFDWTPPTGPRRVWGQPKSISFNLKLLINIIYHIFHNYGVIIINFMIIFILKIYARGRGPTSWPALRKCPNFSYLWERERAQWDPL